MNIRNINYLPFANTQQTKQNKPENLITQPQYGAKNMCSGYYALSFRGDGVKTLREILNSETYMKEMPTTVEDFINNLPSQEKNQLLDVPSLHYVQAYAFDDLKNCSNLDEIKTAFPNEECFQNAVSFGDSTSNQAFLRHFRELLKQDPDCYKGEEDLTTFFIKRIFLECKTFKDIGEELSGLITGDSELHEKVRKLCTNEHQSDIFKALGIKTPNGENYGATMRYSNPKFQEKIKALLDASKRESWKKLTPEEMQTRIDGYLQGKEKPRFVMLDAWNNCPEIRRALSSFITENQNNQKYLSACNDNEYLDFFETNKLALKMRLIMIDFWEENPEFKSILGDQIIKAGERYELKKEKGGEEFEKYKNDIIKKNSELKIKMRVGNTNNFDKAKMLITRIGEKANPLYLKTPLSAKDFSDLLFNSFSNEELKILEGSDSTPEYKALFPNGIINKIRALTRKKYYKNLSNSQLYALLSELSNKTDISSIDSNDTTACAKLFKEALSGNKVTINGKTVDIRKSVPLDRLEHSYGEFKKGIKEEDTEKIKYELFQYCSLSEKEERLAESFLRNRRSYMNLIFKDSMHDKVLTDFWSDYDSFNGTNKLGEVQDSLNLNKLDKQKSDFIKNLDIASLMSFSY